MRGLGGCCAIAAAELETCCSTSCAICSTAEFSARLPCRSTRQVFSIFERRISLLCHVEQSETSLIIYYFARRGTTDQRFFASLRMTTTTQRGNGCSMFASAYARTATTAEFSASSFGTILSSVSAAV